jgi:hypothetical protein
VIRAADGRTMRTGLTRVLATSAHFSRSAGPSASCGLWPRLPPVYFSRVPEVRPLPGECTGGLPIGSFCWRSPSETPFPFLAAREPALLPARKRDRTRAPFAAPARSLGALGVIVGVF